MSAESTREDADDHGEQTGEMVRISGGTNTMPAPGQNPVSMINKQDFRILMEGAGSPVDASARDVAIGIAVSCATTAASLYHSVDFEKKTGPVIMVVVVTCVSVGAAIIALLAHLRTRRDKGRKSYRALIERIKAHVGARDE